MTYTNKSRTLTIDFDGVINSYKSGFKGPAVLPDPPVEGAIDFLKKASKVFKITIFSTRAEDEKAITAMRDWLKKYGLPEGEANAIKITDRKPKATLYIDDRGWQFQGYFPDLEYIKNYQPWYKRKNGTENIPKED